MAPEHLLASAWATASKLYDRRPGDPAAYSARADAWDGCETARIAAHISRPHGAEREVPALVAELRNCPRPGLATEDPERAEAWDAGVELAIRGLEALEALRLHIASVGAGEAAGQSEVPR